MYLESAKANVAKEHCESKLKLTRAPLSRGEVPKCAESVRSNKSGQRP